MDSRQLISSKSRQHLGVDAIKTAVLLVYYIKFKSLHYAAPYAIIMIIYTDSILHTLW